jgi:fatty-acid desaturase
MKAASEPLFKYELDMTPNERAEKQQKRAETYLYLIFAVVAFSFMALGYYLMGLKGIIYDILGMILLLLGIIIGVIFLGIDGGLRDMLVPTRI